MRLLSLLTGTQCRVNDDPVTQIGCGSTVGVQKLIKSYSFARFFSKSWRIGLKCIHVAMCTVQVFVVFLRRAKGPLLVPNPSNKSLIIHKRYELSNEHYCPKVVHATLWVCHYLLTILVIRTFIEFPFIFSFFLFFYNNYIRRSDFQLN